MKFLKFATSLLLSGALFYFLHFSHGIIPPLGKLLDPFSGFWQNATSEALAPQEDISIPGLQQPVKISYDSASIPHIQAQNLHDLYLAQGYVTAQHRLWQMEFQTMAAAGRLSEIVGSRAVSYDQRQRRKGLGFGAENALSMLEKDTVLFSYVQAYSEGVNAYIRQLSPKDFPLEYKILNYNPEPWSPYKTTLLLKYMADMLTGGDVDEQNTNALKLLGSSYFALLYPDFPEGLDPVAPAGTVWDFEPVAVTTPENVQFPLLFSADSTEKREPGIGSNNWAVSGSKTASGSPILANDPHLALNLPSIWYAMHLQSPEVNTMGATLTGALGVISGFNDSIAWGVTNATRDVRDWYKITFRDSRKEEYLFDGKWLKTQKRIEEIKIKGEESRFDTLVFTHHGPIVYDENYQTSHSLAGFALRWIAHDPSQEQRTFFQLNQARNYKEYTEALPYFSCPAQNIVFASNQGDIALWVQGKFPLRWQDQGKFLLDGSQSAYDWQGFIPQDHAVHILNPERGFVSSANQHSADANYPYYIYDNSFEHYRNRRINQRLTAMTGITPQDMMALQMDNYNLKAAEALAVILPSLDSLSASAESEKIKKALQQWDFMNTALQSAPAYFEIWWHYFYRELWKDLWAQNKALRWPDSYVTIAMLQNFENSIFQDNDTLLFHHDLRDLSQSTFAQMVDSVARWEEKEQKPMEWGRLKKSSIQHLAQLAPFSVDNLMVDGNRSIINANSGRNGASWRMVVELSTPVKAYAIYPGGQSGNPGNPAYSDFIEPWRTGKFLSLHFPARGDSLSEVYRSHQLLPNPEQP
ncbi:penicillin acylase family protein [Cytophagales bacterium LB-30]|uniref:Penicillin acylase family protein n=1 Tax=Shiella aurantiaca TaxID=3058365 RepID=A0ABT8F9G2_9BACT|nr:penicillin acylase family protein [Shiella aurantiaca]MDN4166596.1 penicillin acylase family protein [Shiella aurantiaca]